MADNKQDFWKQFAERLDMLGMEAVAARGTDEYVFALRKLQDYFAEKYEAFLFSYERIPRSVWENDTMSKKQEEKLEKISQLWIWANEKIGATQERRFAVLLRKKTETFRPEAANEALPFYTYLFKDLFTPVKHEIQREKMVRQQGGMTQTTSEKQLRIVNAYNKLLQSTDGCITEEIIRTLSHNLGAKEETVRRIISNHKLADTLSFDAPVGGEDSNATLADVTGGENPQLAALEGRTTNDLRTSLLALNEIYDNSFNELHRLVYPPDLTNTLIMDKVKRYQKTNQNYEDAIAENWEQMDIPGDRELFIRPEYKCTAGWVYDLFEELRKRLTNKLLAAKLGISPSRYTKISEQARGIVQQKYQLYRD